jgi:lipid-binding SYLF domain-containing protein
MRRRFLFALSLAALLPAAGTAAPPSHATVDGAIEVLDDLAGAPDKRIPPKLLQEAAAVVIAPDVYKGGLVLGARHGHGVLLVREKGGWSEPIFVTLTGGSVGLQAGLSSTDLFLVVRNARSLEHVLKGTGKLVLGGDASVAAGPVGREAAAATDAQLKAEILSYSRSRGLFAGVALDGDTILVDHTTNDKYYGKHKVTVGEIVAGAVTSPKESATLRVRLAEWSGDVPPPPPAVIGPAIKK